VSETHRYKVVQMLSEDGNNISYAPHGPDIVLADNFDRVTAECNALQQRQAHLEGLLKEASQHVPLFAESLRHRIKAALNPAEGGGDEAI